MTYDTEAVWRAQHILTIRHLSSQVKELELQTAACLLDLQCNHDLKLCDLNTHSPASTALCSIYADNYYGIIDACVLPHVLQSRQKLPLPQGMFCCKVYTKHVRCAVKAMHICDCTFHCLVSASQNGKVLVHNEQQ